MNPAVARLVRRLGADKKRLSLMLGLLAVLGFLWARLLLAPGPGHAAAGPLAAPLNGVAVAGPVAAGNRPVVYADLPATLQRDPFALDAKAFPPAAATLPNPPAPEKSPALPVDVTTEAAARAALVRQAAAGLKLQTTILGEVPRAMINGQLVAAGDTIAGFTVRQVLPRQVVLEREGIQVRLEM